MVVSEYRRRVQVRIGSDRGRGEEVTVPYMNIWYLLTYTKRVETGLAYYATS